MDRPGDLILVPSAFKLGADILHRPVPMDQKQFSGRKKRFVKPIGQINIDHHNGSLFHHHHKEHFRHKSLMRHDGKFKINNDISQEVEKETQNLRYMSHLKNKQQR